RRPRRPSPFPYPPLFRSLGVGAHEVDVEIPDAVDQGAGLVVALARAGEVIGEPAAQVAGLADVDDAVEPVAHDVDAGRVRHVARSEEHTSELQSRENLVC